MFDIAGNGTQVQVAWTAIGSGNAFLVLDRNHNGRIDSGRELFGDATYASDSNGFLALGEYDKPEHGGNGDGIIDARDAIFPRLLLWIDDNHDGICQPSELHALSEFGIYAFSLSYTESPRTDQFGNKFRYRAMVNPGMNNPRVGGRWAYDVFLQTVH